MTCSNWAGFPLAMSAFTWRTPSDSRDGTLVMAYGARRRRTCRAPHTRNAVSVWIGNGGVVLGNPLQASSHHQRYYGMWICGPATRSCPGSTSCRACRRQAAEEDLGLRQRSQNLSPDSQQFQFVEMLAGANGHSVSSDAITRALSAARLQTDGTTTARQAKSRAKKHVIEALQAAGAADRSDPFPSVGPGFYRCRLRCFVG